MKKMTNTNAKTATDAKPATNAKRVTRWMKFKANRELLKEKAEAKLGYDLTYAEYRSWCDDNGYSWRTGTRAVWSAEKRVSLSNRMTNWWKNRSSTSQNAMPIIVAKKEISPAKPIAVVKKENAKAVEDINAKIDEILANTGF